MNEPYTLSDEDVARYFASKQDDEPVGLCQDEEACLLVEAMRFKYPELTGRVVAAFYGELHILGGWPECHLPLSLRQARLLHVFDAMGRQYDPIRKGPFLTRWRRQGGRFAVKQDAFVGDPPMSTTLLFGVQPLPAKEVRDGQDLH